MAPPAKTAARRPPRSTSGVRSARPVAAVAASRGMQRAFALADRVARGPRTSAIVVGETGVGKEVVAHRIHEASDRRSAPFLKVNLAALPAAMIEAELFGSVEGAYTDSRRDRPGILRSADGGTVLLDEITELSIDLQPKLLRVLEDRTFFPVGSDEPYEVDIRFIAATNRKPEDAIREGCRRADLYYRLAAVTIVVPPLRKRDDDLIPLAELFLAEIAEEMDRGELVLSSDAVMALYANEWPGNVRELRNVIERAVLISDDDVISAEHLTSASTPARFNSTLPPPEPDGMSLEEAKQQALERVERRQIRLAMAATGGNKTEAANLLGISRTTLWDKLKTYGFEG
jgi:transcriptional regulator with PAS, ATPase and Fis domain